MNQWVFLFCAHSQLFLNSVKSFKNCSQTPVLPTKIPDKYIQMTVFFHFEGIFGVKLRTKEDINFSLWFESPNPHEGVCFHPLPHKGDIALAHLNLFIMWEERWERMLVFYFVTFLWWHRYFYEIQPWNFPFLER